MVRLRAAGLTVALCVFVPWLARHADAAADVVAFESGPVRPLALSPDKRRLYAVNTPDNQLEIFEIGPQGPKRTGSVAVGLEPVAVAARSNSEVWVVNHLSDSVSVVDVASTPARVTRTLLVGDEPRDVVFAGSGGGRAFVTAAHRGQNARTSGDFFTPGVGRADVWVFDAGALGSSLGGDPLTVVTLFGDSPRALAVSPDGGRVYAAVFLSGNRTTVVPDGAVPPGAMPPPLTNADGVPAPPTSLIVRNDGTRWRDPSGGVWDAQVRFALPDKDVFVLDALADPPREISSFSNVGTVLFNMAVNPRSGRIYVSNTEAKNEVRFEGSGTFGGSTVRSRVHRSRITVLDATGVRARHLNTHLNDGVPTGSDAERARSLAFPLGMVVSRSGGTLYLAAFGSGKIAVISTAAIESGSYTPAATGQIDLPGSGPSGMVLDEDRGRLYVATRFDNALREIRLSDKTEIARIALHNPEPPEVVEGRRIFYDARDASGHGDASCASCHVFGADDGLAWDLGDPDGSLEPNLNPFRFPADFKAPPFHPMKGPMTTQTLRGLSGHGPLHWRADRTGSNPTDTRGAFLRFDKGFVSVLGRSAPLDRARMERLADFILRIVPPPNPVRALDSKLTAAQARGRDFFLKVPSSGAGACVSCHRLDPASGKFGTDGMSAFDGLPQLFKIPTLQGAYTKVGMFGMPEVPLFRSGDNGYMGDQIRGFGFSFDGSVDTLVRFAGAQVFNFPGGDPQRRDVAEFLLAFDSNLAPIVGQQVTRTASNGSVADPRIDLLLQRAAVAGPLRECDVIVKGVVAGQARGWVRTTEGLFRSDRASEPHLTDVELRRLTGTAGQALTWTAVPPGSGTRMGVDRDRDSFLDRDEADSGSDPANPASTHLDRDGDGVVNEADCAPDDGSVWATPGEVERLLLSRTGGAPGATLAWTSQAANAGPGTVYDVATGVLSQLRLDADFRRALCLISGHAGSTYADPRAAPAPGQGDWYLVRGRNVCATGSYGAGSKGPRTVTACP